MKTSELFITAALFLVCAPPIAAAEAAAVLEDESLAVAHEIIMYMRSNDVNNIAVLGFARAGAAGAVEADLVAERVSSYINTFRKTTAAQRSALKDALAELKTPAAGARDGAKLLRDIFSADAVVAGIVSKAGAKVAVGARVIELRTGKVLFATGSGGGSPAPGDFRDSVADYNAGSCAGRKQALAGLNAEQVDAKAAYWAEKLREPLFRTYSNNPGIEIGDAGVRADFYARLAAHYQAGRRAALAPAKAAAIEKLLDDETGYFAECGRP